MREPLVRQSVGDRSPGITWGFGLEIDPTAGPRLEVFGLDMSGETGVVTELPGRDAITRIPLLDEDRVVIANVATTKVQVELILGVGRSTG